MSVLADPADDLEGVGQIDALTIEGETQATSPIETVLWPHYQTPSTDRSTHLIILRIGRLGNNLSKFCLAPRYSEMVGSPF